MMKRMILTAALTVGLFVGAMGTAEAKTDRMMVVGDSITARYNDKPGDPMRGWWSRLAAKQNMRVSTSAISGTGFINKGSGCSQRNYLQRINSIAKTRPKVLIIEGGRNDFHLCQDRMSKGEIDRGVARYFNKVNKIVKRYRIKKVYVVTVWGTKFSKDKTRVTAIVGKHAKRSGYPYKVITLGNSMTVDGTHPNRAGNVKMYRLMNNFVRRG